MPLPNAGPLLKQALVVASAVVSLPLLSWLVFIPLHSRGVAQPVLAVLNSAASLISAPGRRVAIVQFYTGPPGQRLPLVEVLGLLLSWVFYFGIAAVVIALWRDRRRGPNRPLLRASGVPQTEEKRDQQPQPDGGSSPISEPGLSQGLSRRAFLVRTAGLSAAGAATVGGAGVAAYATVLEPRQLPVTRRRLPLSGLPPELTGLRVVQLTDIHHGPWMSRSFVERVVSRTNALKPDLVLLTGDYVVAGENYIRPVVSILKGLRPRIGVAATLGNHDWWSGVGQVHDAFRDAALPLIDNGRLYLTPERRLTAHPPRSGAGLCVAGVGDYWEDSVDFSGALAPVPESMPRLVLCHNPDAAESSELRRSNQRVDLLMCGHTHGGQVRLPGLGTPVVPSRFGQKYVSGLVQGPLCPVFVSRGIGLTVLPLRFNVPPEIALFELVPV